ncbi:UrcA family protein [Sphingosinicella terrae]|uniref:UrcA family protein n=1 Tax=Sphingosinicella terrae TaxID=2172047 RepID=UPI000E0D6B3C|nr:UrcA family protein [Sphingosinicella terrae]
MKMLTTLVALAATTALLAPATAQSSSTHTESVRYADLDLARPDGVRELDRRLRTAIENACGPISSADPAGKRAVRACRTSLRNAVSERRNQVLAGIDRPEPIVVALAR